MPTSTRRLVPLLLAGLLLVPFAGTASAKSEPVTEAVLAQAGRDLVKLTTAARRARPDRLRMDPDLMAIARDLPRSWQPTTR